MLDELKRVYSMFEDSLSKEIWINRLNYIVSDDYEYIADILELQGEDIACRPSKTPEDLMNQYDEIVFYGAGDDALFYRSWFEKFDRKRVIGFCDGDAKKCGRDIFGYRIISPEELPDHKDSFILITSTKHSNEIKETLLKKDIKSDRIIDGFFPTLNGPSNMYFDTNIIDFDNSGEIFVDGGSYDLGTIKDLARRVKIRKAYAFEADPVNVERCKKEIRYLKETQLFPCGLWGHKDELEFSSTGDTEASFFGKDEGVSVQVSPLDEIIPEDEVVTFIKLDIEGAELEALKGAQRTIKRCRPKLAICIYHKTEDMYELPLFVKDLVPEYRLYIRHYSNRAHETVMYAVL